VGQEQIDRTDDLGLYRIDTDQVLQAHLGLAGPDEGVRRTPGGEQRGQHDGAEHPDDEQDREGRAQPVRHVERREDAVTGDTADDDPPEDQGADRHQTAETGKPAALTGLGHIGAAEDGVAHDPGDGMGGHAVSAGTCEGGDLFGRPAHDRLRSLPRGRFLI
jgi:hypothetical protein